MYLPTYMCISIMYYMGVHIIYTRGNSLSVSAFVWSHCIWIVICLPLIIVIVLYVPRVCVCVCVCVSVCVAEQCKKRYYDFWHRILFYRRVHSELCVSVTDTFERRRQSEVDFNWHARWYFIIICSLGVLHLAWRYSTLGDSAPCNDIEGENCVSAQTGTQIKHFTQMSMAC